MSVLRTHISEARCGHSGKFQEDGRAYLQIGRLHDSSLFPREFIRGYEGRQFRRSAALHSGPPTALGPFDCAQGRAEGARPGTFTAYLKIGPSVGPRAIVVVWRWAGAFGCPFDSWRG